MDHEQDNENEIDIIEDPGVAAKAESVFHVAMPITYWFAVEAYLIERFNLLCSIRSG